MYKLQYWKLLSKMYIQHQNLITLNQILYIHSVFDMVVFTYLENRIRRLKFALHGWVYCYRNLFIIFNNTNLTLIAVLLNYDIQVLIQVDKNSNIIHLIRSKNKAFMLYNIQESFMILAQSLLNRHTQKHRFLNWRNGWL